MIKHATDLNHFIIPYEQEWQLLDMYFWNGIAARDSGNPCGTISYEAINDGS